LVLVTYCNLSTFSSYPEAKFIGWTCNVLVNTNAVRGLTRV